MWKEEVRGGLLGEVINWKALYRELEDKDFTGFVKIEAWEFTDYVILEEGKPIKAVRVYDGEKEYFSIGEYKPPKESKVSLFKSSPLTTAHICKVYDFESLGTLLISGYGNEVFYSGVNIIDPSNLEKFVGKVSFTGYVTCYTSTEVLCNVFFLDGKIIGINLGKLWDDEAIKRISIPSSAYLSVYAIEPEEVLLLNSIKRGFNGNGKYGFLWKDRVFTFVMDGDAVKSVKLDTESIKEVSPLKEGHFYSVKLDENPETLGITLADIFGKKPEKVSKEIVKSIKEHFVDHMGPIGNILWHKILKDLHLNEEGLTKTTLRVLVYKLKDEIPEEDLRDSFINKVKEVFNEIDT
ncbi:hypothetical protein JCM9492_10370 [Aquifex pyrophilus]